MEIVSKGDLVASGQYVKIAAGVVLQQIIKPSWLERGIELGMNQSADGPGKAYLYDLRHAQAKIASRYAHLLDDPLRAATARVAEIAERGKL